MKEVNSPKDVYHKLGIPIPKKIIVTKNSSQRPRHLTSNEKEGDMMRDLFYASFMKEGQVITSELEKRDGAEQRELTDNFNEKNGIAD